MKHLFVLRNVTTDSLCINISRTSLPEIDHLSIQDSLICPRVSIIEEFHCIEADVFHLSGQRGEYLVVIILL